MLSRKFLLLMGGSGFNPKSLFAGDTVGGWWDPSDLSTLFQDAGMTVPVTANDDPVGAILDKSGNGNHLLQVGAGTTRPLYKTAGGLRWIEGDGINDYLQAAFSISQPFERLSAIRVLSWVIGNRIFSGAAADTCRVYMAGTEPNLNIFAGGAIAFANEPATGTDFVTTERYNGALSRWAIDNNAYQSGNIGAGVPGGFTLFATHAGTVSATARYYGGIMRAGLMTDSQITQVRRYVAAKAGQSL